MMPPPSHSGLISSVFSALQDMLKHAMQQPVWPVLAAAGSLCIVLGFIALPLGVIGLLGLLYLKLVTRNNVGTKHGVNGVSDHSDIFAPIDGRIIKQLETPQYKKIICQPSLLDSQLIFSPLWGRCEEFINFAGLFADISVETDDNIGGDNAYRSYQFRLEDDTEITLDIYAHRICRFILSFCEEGVTVTPADRLGLGLLAPMVVITVPAGYELELVSGQRCLAGDTVLAKKKG